MVVAARLRTICHDPMVCVGVVCERVEDCRMQLGLIRPVKFICIAQDIPPYKEIPATD